MTYTTSTKAGKNAEERTPKEALTDLQSVLTQYESQARDARALSDKIKRVMGVFADFFAYNPEAARLFGLFLANATVSKRLSIAKAFEDLASTSEGWERLGWASLAGLVRADSSANESKPTDPSALRTVIVDSSQ